MRRDRYTEDTITMKGTITMMSERPGTWGSGQVQPIPRYEWRTRMLPGPARELTPAELAELAERMDAR